MTDSVSANLAGDRLSTKRGIAAVIPAFNEEKTIGEVVSSMAAACDEVIVVDDGSNDDTARIAHQAGATVVSHGRNMGYGAAISTGFQCLRALDHGCAVLIDADGQHDAGAVSALAIPVEADIADVVIGSRFLKDLKGVPFHRRLGVRLINSVYNFGCEHKVSDTQCGLRAFSRTAIERIDIESRGMEASIEMLIVARRKGLRIREIPCSVEYNSSDRMILSPAKQGFRLARYAVMARFREMLNPDEV